MDDVAPAPEKRQTRYQKDKARGKNTPCGEVDCPTCGIAAPVFRRRDAVGRKYYNCPKCGQNYCIKEAGQRWIADHMRAPGQPAAPKQKPEPEPVEPVVKESSMLASARKFIIG